MKIPKEFKLFGNTIKVVFDKDKCEGADAYGIADFKTDTIYLQTKAHGKPIVEEEIESTFLHEMIHFVLARTGHEELSDNEQLVKTLSRALHQCLTTQKF